MSRPTGIVRLIVIALAAVLLWHGTMGFVHHRAQGVGPKRGVLLGGQVVLGLAGLAWAFAPRKRG